MRFPSKNTWENVDRRDERKQIERKTFPKTYTYCRELDPWARQHGQNRIETGHTCARTYIHERKGTDI